MTTDLEFKGADDNFRPVSFGDGGVLQCQHCGEPRLRAVNVTARNGCSTKLTTEYGMRDLAISVKDPKDMVIEFKCQACGDDMCLVAW
jgi:hypothetical protein